MVAGIDVAKIGHIRQLWYMLLPATTPKQKAVLWQCLGRLKKERIHPRFAVWQAVPEKPERSCKAYIRLDRIMRRGVQSVVDGHTGAGPEGLIRLDHRRATTIG